MKGIAILVAMSTLASALNAQASVHVVDHNMGPGSGFATIGSAVQAASEGDLILVRSGTYPDFMVDARSVTIAAAAGATVLVRNQNPMRPRGFEVTNLGPSQRVLIPGIGVTWAGASPGLWGDGAVIPEPWSQVRRLTPSRVGPRP